MAAITQEIKKKASNRYQITENHTKSLACIDFRVIFCPPLCHILRHADGLFYCTTLFCSAYLCTLRHCTTHMRRCTIALVVYTCAHCVIAHCIIAHCVMNLHSSIYCLNALRTLLVEATSRATVIYSSKCIC